MNKQPITFAAHAEFQDIEKWQAVAA